MLLVNLDPRVPFDVHRGDRIAQLVLQRVQDIEWEEAATLDETARGLGGWGSSGTK